MEKSMWVMLVFSLELDFGALLSVIRISKTKVHGIPKVIRSLLHSSVSNYEIIIEFFLC